MVSGTQSAQMFLATMLPGPKQKLLAGIIILPSRMAALSCRRSYGGRMLA